jgi:hypothetical protein
MTKTTTERTGCFFETKDGDDGTFWITVSFDKPGLPTIGNGFIGFEFRKKMTVKEADDFSRLLRDTLGEISITRFHD